MSTKTGISPINQHCTIILKFCPRVRDSVHHLTYLTLWQWLQYQKQQQRHAARYLVIQSRPSASLTLGWVFNFLLESLHQDKWFSDFFFLQPNFKWLIHQTTTIKITRWKISSLLRLLHFEHKFNKNQNTANKITVKSLDDLSPPLCTITWCKQTSPMSLLIFWCIYNRHKKKEEKNSVILCNVPMYILDIDCDTRHWKS